MSNCMPVAAHRDHYGLNSGGMPCVGCYLFYDCDSADIRRAMIPTVALPALLMDILRTLENRRAWSACSFRRGRWPL
jgi:hypothetical protein